MKRIIIMIIKEKILSLAIAAKTFSIYNSNNIIHHIINSEIYNNHLNYSNNNNIIHHNYNLNIIHINIIKILNGIIIDLNNNSNNNNNFTERKCNYIINKKQNYQNFQKIMQTMIGIIL